MSTKLSQVQQDESAHIKQPATSKFERLLPYTFLLSAELALLLTGAILPLHGLWFHAALLIPLNQWLLFPAHLLFPGKELTPTLFQLKDVPPTVAQSWQATGLLLGAFIVIFVVYAGAIFYLPRLVRRRAIILATILLGTTCILMPVVLSPDILSYISYARMGVIYHLNPLVAIPRDIQHDPIYPHLYWIDQPSAYGPTWALLSCALQWLIELFFGPQNIGMMVLALRVLGLISHVCAVLLVWAIAGHLLRQQKIPLTPARERARTLATLAFAWNPLLLFEACVNAHNDTIVLLFVLLALWFLVRTTTIRPAAYIPATILLVLAACLKINVALFVPGLLVFIWAQTRQLRAAIITLVLYGGLIIAFYAPFWQGGAILNLLHANPGTYRAINTFPDFLSHFYNSIVHLAGYPLAADAGSPAENALRLASLGLFAISYCLLCWKTIGAAIKLRPLSIAPSSFTVLQLIRWMALAWFLYNILGSPWFWPWYTTIFFGLFALLEATGGGNIRKPAFLARWSSPWLVCMLAFSMLSLYCFHTWAPSTSFVAWLPGFRWTYLRGLWAWLVPPLTIWALSLVLHRQKSQAVSQKLINK
ncbi:hypothetical protein EPA93_40270 [Ktedonosporobacter rubrisoli]|uniref:DUF2029 domain-containing protein n=1 Tax=Ktedonosporobacter rubrisoli TaxID=2509675 RepID=A0A4P6K1X5_KTERU|nr:hypothetical protein [Ktedonosporobacter rubrisoli]QBD81882.1 hypothetical protein EPA93_40270 [Ktedonosporobacter rubrisoli]